MSTHYKSLTRRTNPETVPLFPLSGALLLPGCELPLNVFEPRYLNMVDDAIKADRIIAMIQPNDDDGLSEIGTIGRIRQFSEMDDGRYLIVLKGLKRFKCLDIVESSTPYNQARVDFSPFERDADLHVVDMTAEAMSQSARSERAALTVAMKSFAKSLGVDVDWDSLKEIPLPRLIDQAAMISPFNPNDKQSLLETETREDRRRLLIGLMHLYATMDGDDNNRPMQ